MRFSLDLPKNFRSAEVLAFHARDPERLSEQVDENHFRKGMVLGGAPTVIDISLTGKKATCRVGMDGKSDIKLTQVYFKKMVQGLLGLTMDPLPFERAFGKERFLGTLIQKQKGLRLPQAATAFEALTWAVIGQQIHLSFAISLRRTLIRLAGRKHSSGLWCYPDAAALSKLRLEKLTAQKFSQAKAGTLIRLARMVQSGAIPLDVWREGSTNIVEIEKTLLAVKGVGPWTVHYALLRGFGMADCSLHGDAAVKNAVHRITGGDKPDTAKVEEFLERYRPHRSMAAAHLWASLKIRG